MTTAFIQTEPDAVPFSGHAIEHLQAVLDGLDYEPYLDFPIDGVLSIGEECECGGVFEFRRGEARTYDYPGSDDCVACSHCGEGVGA